VRYFAVFENAGTPATGLSPVIVWRNGDGTAAGAPPVVTELDAVNAPGWYWFEASPAVRIVVTWDGTVGLAVADRYQHLVISPDDFPQTNKRVVYTAWTASGKPTAGLILLYESQADMLADVDPWNLAEQTYPFTTTYDGSDQPTEYTQGKN
jgi:hypothetical protein